jgi:hypothetical protein
MKYWPIILLTTSVLAQTAPNCPSESLLIEFMSPITGGKKAFCGYLKDGQTVKHGEEWSYDKNGNLLKKTTFQHGINNEGPANLSGPKSEVEEKKIIGNISELLRILTLKKTAVAGERFQVSKCDNAPLEWLKGAIFNTSIPKNYMFIDKCDVSGDFVASFVEEFTLEFQLRNLEDFNHVKMRVKMSANKANAGIRYKFEVIEGYISSPKRNANFNVNYEIDINPLTGEAEKASQRGRVSLSKVNGSEVNAEAPLRYDD